MTFCLTLPACSLLHFLNDNNLQAKDLPGPLSSKAQALVEALEGKVRVYQKIMSDVFIEGLKSLVLYIYCSKSTMRNGLNSGNMLAPSN